MNRVSARTISGNQTKIAIAFLWTFVDGSFLDTAASSASAIFPKSNPSNDKTGTTEIASHVYN